MLLPVCSDYGVWDEHAGWVVFSADWAMESGTWAATLRTEAPDAELAVREVRSEHAEHPAAGCEDCFADEADDRV